MVDYKKELRQKRIEDNELKHNGSGYLDMTGYTAIKNIEGVRDRGSYLDQRINSDYERFHKLLGCILRICELSDFRLDGRIEVTDLRSGKHWR